MIKKIFEDHINIAKKSSELLLDAIGELCIIVDNAIVNGNKILIIGNGGSAADAQHIAAEFTGRFLKERKGLPAIALTTDTSALTAIGNDYGFEKIFERQVTALANSNDILIGISTSGNSENIISAFKAGNKIGCINIAFTGCNGGKVDDLVKLNIVVPSDITARIQEIHILIGHILCSYIDKNF